MKHRGVEISEKKIRWLYWYVKIGIMFMVIDRRNAEMMVRR